MSWLLFIGEPSHKIYPRPYNVLSALAVEDINVWDLIKKLEIAQMQYFGRHLNHDDMEHFCKNSGSVDQLTSSLEYTENQTNISKEKWSAYFLFATHLARDYDVKAFAMITSADSSKVVFTGRLRKDYSYLFERFYNFLNSLSNGNIGMIVMEGTKSDDAIIKKNNITEYFLKTNNGRIRSKLIMPEPLMANGYIDKIFQLTQLLGFVVSWGVRLQGMTVPRRHDLNDLVAAFNNMRFSYRLQNGNKDWSFKFISDVNPS